MERYGNDITIVPRNPAKKENINYADKYASLTVGNRRQTLVFRRCNLFVNAVFH